MTDRQRMYLDLRRHGYTLEEIAYMTDRSVNTVRATLEKAAAKDCMSPGNCRVCALKKDCEGIRRTITGSEVFRRREPSGGRYSY